MEFASRVIDGITRAINNDRVISVFLVGSFVALSVRSMSQQRGIEALEAEKNSLTNSNKVMKKSIWEWKQLLFAEAATEPALVPLSRLKAIYGEAQAPQIGDAVKEDSKSTVPKFVV